MSDETGVDRQVDDVAARVKGSRATIGALLLFLLGFGGWAAVRTAADGIPVETITVGAGREARFTGPGAVDVYPDRWVLRGGTFRSGLASTLPVTSSTAPVGSK